MTDQTATTRQSWKADTYAADGRFVADLAGEVMAWLAPINGERILDLGCGDGVLTAQLKDLGVDVIGVDMSDDLLAAAAKRGLDVRKMDGQALTFASEFDAVFSNAALHWMLDAQAVIDGIWRALKPGGRFVGEFGGHGNVASMVTAMRAVGKHRGGDMALAGPWFFPTPEIYQQMLEQQGFKVRRCGLYPRPTKLKTGMTAWLKLMRKPFFDQFGDDMPAVLAEVEDLLSPSLCDANGNWTADYVRIRIEAIKP